MVIEYQTYKLVKRALERCEELGVVVSWGKDNWKAMYGEKLTIGFNAGELLMYVNGIEDGISSIKNIRNEETPS